MIIGAFVATVVATFASYRSGVLSQYTCGYSQPVAYQLPAFRRHAIYAPMRNAAAVKSTLSTMIMTFLRFPVDVNTGARSTAYGRE